jgi:rod shape-determining protein MreC
MRAIIEMLSRYGHVVLFIFLELFCFLIIINFNIIQGEIWTNTTGIFSDAMNARVKAISNYSQLELKNDSLRLENARLLQQIVNFRVSEDLGSFQEFVDKNEFNYKLIPVTVCSKTIHLTNNTMTLCQGTNDGLSKRMGIITKKGVVGITASCSENFCKSLFVINRLSQISGKILGKDYTGNVTWQKRDPRILTMNAVPKYANVALGDTIVTSGYSTMFPPNIPIGIVSNYKEIRGQNELEIEVAMLEDLGKITEAYAVEYEYALEKKSLKKEGEDE